MKILFLSQLVPYPIDAGPKVRSFHVLEYLVSAGHDVTLVAFSRATDKQESINHLQNLCQAVHTVPINRSKLKDAQFFLKSLIRQQPFLIARDHEQNMYKLLETLMKDEAFDAVHVDQLWMAPYGLFAQKCARGTIKTVLDQHNAVYLVPQRMAEGSSNPLKKLLLTLEKGKLSQYELDVCSQYDVVTWVTDEDRQALKEIAKPGLHTIQGPTIPICVDVDSKPQVIRSSSPHCITFLGGLHWPPNAEGMLWFFEEVWPNLKLKLPNAVLTIIGKQPPARLVAAAEDDPNLEVTGFVDDPTPYLRETAAFIVPLHSGGGMRVKIIDGWSWGLPIISTTIGAEGIAYSDQKDILIADDPIQFGQNIVNLFESKSLGDAIIAAGRNTVETQFNWRVVYTAWNDIYALESENITLQYST